MRLLGAWPLQLEGSDPAPIRRSMQWLREGGAVVIFPEGGRGNTDGSMKKFKPGAVRMALETGAAMRTSRLAIELPFSAPGAN